MTDPFGSLLLVLARSAIGEHFGLPGARVSDDPRLGEKGAAFVTLTLDGELRGCIGTIEAHRSLGEDVRKNAAAAALRDPRFSPLTAEEFARVKIEVSVLSAVEAMPHRTEEDILAQLRPGKDGVVIRYQGRQATYLPQVWRHFADPKKFLAELKRKAWLDAEFWSPDMEVGRYTLLKWSEEEP
ncbi:MAG: AmmeMemoRadiSam system protein A [Pseudomonadota bacterium]